MGGLPDGSFIAIDVGQRHSVALRSSGYLWAQGGLFWPYGYDEGDEPGGVISSPVVERYSYDVYGKPTIKAPDGSTRTTSAYGNRYMFTGREYDKEAGLYYYRARYYSPTLGRFLQTDPIGIAGGINIYTYCLNNPVNFADPWGLLSGPDHEYLTRRAMKEAGFSDSDIDKVVKANRSVDRLSNQWNNPAHYMPRYLDEAEKSIEEQLQKAKSSKASGKTDKSLEELGTGLHTLQDKYPHKDNGSWGNHIKGKLPFVSSPDDNWGTSSGNAYKDTKDYLKKYIEKNK